MSGREFWLWAILAMALAGCARVPDPQALAVSSEAPKPPPGEYWLPNCTAHVVDVDGHRWVVFRTVKFQNGVALSTHHHPDCPCGKAGAK